WGDHTHVASSDARDWLINDARVRPERITMIPHGVDVDRFTLPSASRKLDARVDLGLAPMDLVALFVGRFDYPKNEQWLIDVLLAARPQINDFKMVILGEGPREGQLRQRIARDALEDRVKIF